MSAFKCKDCDHTFDEPEFYREREIIDYGIGKMWVTIWEGEVCPKCESNQIEENLNEDDDATEPDETLGVRLQQGEATADDRQGMAYLCQARDI